MVYATTSGRNGMDREKDVVPLGDQAARRALWVVASGILIAWSAHNALLLPWELRSIEEGVREPLLVLVRGVVWLVPVFLYLSRYEPRPPLIALGVASKVDGKGLAWSTLGAVVYLALVVWVLLAAAAPGEAPAETAALMALPSLYSLLAVTLEELLLRGFLLRQLFRFTTSFRAQVCVALLFALMHLPAWLTLQGFGPYLVPSMINLVVLGAVLGAVTRGSNSIVLAILIHFANNLMGDLLGVG